jgi:methyl-accepting chemotaxis protein
MATESHKLVSELTEKANEAQAVWVDANQKILKGLMDLYASTAKEGTRLYADLQSSAIEAAIEGQGAWVRQPTNLVEWLKDPFAAYQKSLREVMEQTQNAFKLAQRNAQAFSQSTERLRASAEQAATDIQEALAALTSDMKRLHSEVEK